MKQSKRNYDVGENISFEDAGIDFAISVRPTAEEVIAEMTGEHALDDAHLKAIRFIVKDCNTILLGQSRFGTKGALQIAITTRKKMHVLADTLGKSNFPIILDEGEFSRKVMCTWDSLVRRRLEEKKRKIIHLKANMILCMLHMPMPHSNRKQYPECRIYCSIFEGMQENS